MSLGHLAAVGDLGALLRWVGLIQGPPPPVRWLVSADALLAEVVEYLKVRYDRQPEPIASALAEIQFSVREWQPTWPVAGRLVSVATTAGADLDATLLVPIAVAAEARLPLVTLSPEVAEIAHAHVESVLLI